MLRRCCPWTHSLFYFLDVKQFGRSREEDDGKEKHRSDKTAAQIAVSRIELKKTKLD